MTEKKIHRTNNYYLKQIANNTGSHITTHRTNNYLLKQIAENTKGGGNTPTWQSNTTYTSNTIDLGVTINSNHFKVKLDFIKQADGSAPMTGIIIGAREWVGTFIDNGKLYFVAQNSRSDMWVYMFDPIFDDNNVCHAEFEYWGGKITTNYTDEPKPMEKMTIGEFNFIYANNVINVENIKLWVYPNE
jgi:hypothetical protein